MSKPTIPAVLCAAAILAAALCAPTPASAQVLTGAPVMTGAPLPVISAPPPTEQSRVFDAAELDRILSPIALYPDPLLAQVLSAAAFPSEIPTAMLWVDARRGRTAEQLVSLLAAERVEWDPSVQALVAFPTVLQMMATSMPWTTEIGHAFRLQREDVMDAVQRLREQAQRYGYLRSTSELRVVQSPAIEILPVNPAYVVVPHYDPIVVFAPPRPRFHVSSAIYLGYGVRLGLWYEPWGWRSSGIYWSTRHVYGGYPGWNRARAYRPIHVTYRPYEPRYGSRPQGWDRDRDRDRDRSYPRDSPRRDDNGRNRGNNSGNDGRGNREMSYPGRTAQPRAAQPRTEQPPRVMQRVAERASPPSREVQRSSPAPSSRGSSEARTARRRN